MRKLSSVEDTYWDRVSDLSLEVGILFLGFKERVRDKTKTKCKLYCKKHKLYWETTNISNFLRRKKNPCKICSKEQAANNIRVSEDDYKTVVEDACKIKRSTFLGWSGGFTGVTSKIIQRCNLHGDVWDTTHARRLINGDIKTSGCPACQQLQFRSSIDKNTYKLVDVFEGTGKFPDGTTFSRNLEKKTKAGVLNYWDVFCPICKETNTSFTGSLSKGVTSLFL